MRICHWMAVVLAAASALSLFMSGAPELGLVFVLDVAALACATALLRHEPRIRKGWSWTTRRGEGPRTPLESVALACLTLAVVAYQATIALVMAAVFVLVIVTGIAAVLAITAALSGRL